MNFSYLNSTVSQLTCPPQVLDGSPCTFSSQWPLPLSPSCWGRTAQKGHQCSKTLFRGNGFEGKKNLFPQQSSKWSRLTCLLVKHFLGRQDNIFDIVTFANFLSLSPTANMKDLTNCSIFILCIHYSSLRHDLILFPLVVLCFDPTLR